MTRYTRNQVVAILGNAHDALNAMNLPDHEAVRVSHKFNAMLKKHASKSDNFLRYDYLNAVRMELGQVYRKYDINVQLNEILHKVKA